jgi:hypothetical protein
MSDVRPPRQRSLCARRYGAPVRAL